MTSINQTGTNSNALQEWAMVVDDDDPIREFVVQQFIALGLEAVSAAGAEIALRVVEERDSAPLLVLVDVMMPGIDGLTLARKLRSRFQGRTKIVIISGHLNDDSWWPVDLRDVAFLPKPFRLSDIERMVGEARAGRENAS